MGDFFLPRLVTVGLVALTAGAMAASTVLKLKGVEATDLTTIAAGGVGALAGFIARGNRGPDTPDA